MVRRVAYLTAVVGVASVLAGCAMSFLGGGDAPRRSTSSVYQGSAWRAKAEAACLESRVETPFVVQIAAIDGRGSCGIAHPLKVSAFAEGSVALGPAATMGCPMNQVLEGWLQDSVQPAAIAWFGLPVVSVKQIADYSCRSRNNKRGAKLSEHAFGNALDIAGFVLEDGRTITVKKGWRGTSAERGFLREILASACERFNTALGPGAPQHGDHFHLDLARHGKKGTARYCNPKPLVTPPTREPYAPTRIASPVNIHDPVFTGSIVPDDPFGVSAYKGGDPIGAYLDGEPDED